MNKGFMWANLFMAAIVLLLAARNVNELVAGGAARADIVWFGFQMLLVGSLVTAWLLSKEKGR